MDRVMEWGRAPLRAATGAAPRVVTLTLLVMAVGLAGCAAGSSQTGSHGGLSPLVAGKAKPTPVPSLPWRTVAFPPGVSPATAALAVSPVNGRVAWICAPAAGGAFQIWRSQDAARTWSQVSTLTPGAQLPTPICEVSPDQGDANALAVNINWGGGNGPTTIASGSVDYYSVDSGVTWTQLPADLWLQQVFTAGATTYALALALTSPNSTASLLASADHFASWRTVATPPEQPSANDELWVASDPHELIWSQMNSGLTFHSNDGGATWTPLPTPSAQQIQVTQAVWSSGASNWLLCGYTSVAQATGPATTSYFCSSDLGATWRSVSILSDTWSCDHCGAGAQSGTEPCLPDAGASDGALLALCGVDTSQDTASSPRAPGLTLSRLTPEASAWATIGQTPCPFSAQITLAQTGQLWCQLAATQPPQDYVLDSLP